MSASRRTLARQAAACALLIAAGALGCTDNSPDHTGPPSHSPRPPTAIQTCTKLISYWAEQDLIGSTWAGLDWEQKGLSNDQYMIYDKIVHAARAEKKKHGLAAAKKLIHHRAKERCTAKNGATHSSENWRPPT